MVIGFVLGGDQPFPHEGNIVKSYTLLTVVNHIPNRGGGEISKKKKGWSMSLS